MQSVAADHPFNKYALAYAWYYIIGIFENQVVFQDFFKKYTFFIKAALYICFSYRFIIYLFKIYCYFYCFVVK